MSERVSHWMIRREFTRSPFIQRAASSGRARVTELWNAYPRFSSRIKFHEKNRRIIFRSSFFFFLFFSSPPSSFFPLNRSFQLSFDIGNPIVYFLLAFVYLFQRIHSAFFRSIPSTRALRFKEKKKKKRGEGKFWKRSSWKVLEKSNRRKEINCCLAEETWLGRINGWNERWKGREHW